MLHAISRSNSSEEEATTELSLGKLQSYCTTTKLWKLTVVLYYYEALETCSRIDLWSYLGELAAAVARQGEVVRAMKKENKPKAEIDIQVF
jgi:hypothetical protein